MVQRRRHPRIARTGDLSATLRPAEQPARFGALVFDLSEGGMLIAGGGLEVGECIGIELTGPHFQLAGQAEVAHCTGRKTGLHIVSWAGPADRLICALIAARLPVAPVSASRRMPLTAHQPRSSGALMAVFGDDPLRALSALIVEGSDDDAALAASLPYSPPAGSWFS
jgi:hypothetical protein